MVGESMFEAINAHDTAKISELLTDDATMWDPTVPAPVKGKRAIEDFMRQQFATFPDANVKAVNTIESGDTAVFEIEWTGTQKGPIEAPGMPTIPPTNKRVTGRGVIVGTARDGKITSFKVYYDTGSMMAQLGLLGPK